MGAKKKKGKKKSSPNALKKGTKSDNGDDGRATVSGRCGNGGISGLGPEPIRINDVSSLLFDSKNKDTQLPFSLPFIGPISIAERGANAEENENGIVTSGVSHGRGLVTNRDVSPGECLFVIRSIASADVSEVSRRFLEEGGGRSDTNIEQMTEDSLVGKVQSLCEILDDEEIQPKENVDRARRLLAAFTAQMSSEELPERKNPAEWMEILVANESLPNDDYRGKASLDRDTILSIIHRNAFGPDYHNYAKIEECWTKRANTENCYNRLLGAYPLSAMINHSCSPNAVRVFGYIPSPPRDGKTAATSEIDNIQGREVMIVHANASIPKGTEIRWSYLPPSTPFLLRRDMLRGKYGFTCQCGRCTKEEEALSVTPELKELCALADHYWSLRNAGQQSQGDSLVQSIENIFASKRLSNELQRYLRVGYSSLYMEFFNAAVSLENDESISSALQMATQLHFSFASCNNASTEHLSILHLCYDLSTLVRSHAIKGGSSDDAINRAMSQVRFWTEQLKKAHMVRYGALGEDLETIREAMTHSKLVLRNLEGWRMANNRFI